MDLIGIDIFREIISYPITLRTYLSLRRVSKKVKELADDNVQTIIYDKEERIKNFIPPEFILRMKKIREISHKYNILVEYLREYNVIDTYRNYIDVILNHSTLLSANLSVLDAKGTASTFSHYIKNKKNYNFTLRTKSTNEYVTLTNRRVTFHYLVDYGNDQRYFMDRIDFDKEVMELVFIDCSFDIFKCLTKYIRDKIYFDKIILDYRKDVRESYSLGEILTKRLTYEEACEYHLYVSKLAITNYHRIIKTLLHKLHGINLCFSRIKKFFPLPLKLKYLKLVRNLFPHLKTLTIIGKRIKKKDITSECINFIDNYQDINIIVYDDDEQECDYRSLFPSYLHDKIVYISF